MAVGKKSIQRAAGSIRETKSESIIQNGLRADTKETISFQQEQGLISDPIHEKKFQVISSIKSDLPDYLL